MASGYGNGSHPPPADRFRAVPPPGPDSPFQDDGAWKNGGFRAPDLPSRSPARSPRPNPDLPRDPSDLVRDLDNMEDRRTPDRGLTPRSKSGRSTSGHRVCKKCNLQLTGQFVRALDGTFHLDCFRCRVR